MKQSHMELVVDKLIEFSGGKDEELRDISGLGVILAFLPRKLFIQSYQHSRQSRQNCLLMEG